MPETLALLGGPKAIAQPLEPFNEIGEEELEAVKQVLASGVLSGFLGAWDEKFFGGPVVQELERDWECRFDIAHAISVNSATSGLIAAVGALGLEPGDEVIVSPWTMSATATSILVWNAIPIFADIEPETFNIDPVSIEANITDRTRAIMVPDIFGHAARLSEIMEIAARHGLKVIEDAAQAPGALYHNRRVGTVADIGVFSLNCHKHIQAGEGGVCVTGDAGLARRMQLIRNHAESVVGDMGHENLVNMVGFNFRLSELHAAVAVEQLKKLDRIVGDRQQAAAALDDGLSGLAGLSTPKVLDGCTHVYYVYGLKVETGLLGVPRGRIAEALRAEGVPIGEGYALAHRLPMYQQEIAYGSRGFPWSGGIARADIRYENGICPVAEQLQDETFLAIGLCNFRFSPPEIRAIVKAFRKVWENLDALRQV